MRLSTRDAYTWNRFDRKTLSVLHTKRNCKGWSRILTTTNWLSLKRKLRRFSRKFWKNDRKRTKLRRSSWTFYNWHSTKFLWLKIWPLDSVYILSCVKPVKFYRPLRTLGFICILKGKIKIFGTQIKFEVYESSQNSFKFTNTFQS